MSKFYHIPSKGLINLDLEEFCEVYDYGDICFYTNAGCSILEEFGEKEIKDYDEYLKDLNS